jgi:hypothetical protein
MATLWIHSFMEYLEVLPVVTFDSFHYLGVFFNAISLVLGD